MYKRQGETFKPCGDKEKMSEITMSQSENFEPQGDKVKMSYTIGAQFKVYANSLFTSWMRMQYT